MSKVDDLTRLKHMRDAAQEALSFTKNRTRDDLDTDRMLSLALVRLVEIIGEAGNRVSEAGQAKYSKNTLATDCWNDKSYYSCLF